MVPKNRPPTHPGEILLEEFLKPMGLSQNKFARLLGGTWTQPKINEICKNKRGITEATALDFADAFGTTAEFWMGLQAKYALWKARKKHTTIPKIKIKDVNLCLSEQNDKKTIDAKKISYNMHKFTKLLP